MQNKCIVGDNVGNKLSELIGDRIRELGLKKSDVARMAGISRQYLGNIVNETAATQSGQYRLSPETTAGLAKALRLPEADILSAMNYLQSPILRTPNNVAEFFVVLNRLGLTVSIDRAVEEFAVLDADDLQEMLDTLAAAAIARIKRRVLRR